MSTWNYGVAKKNGQLGIHEEYDDDNGNVHSLSAEPVSPVHEDPDQLKTRETWEALNEALQENPLSAGWGQLS
jgi:hypothetical protein